MKRKRLIFLLVTLLLLAWGYGFARFIVEIETMKPQQNGEKTDAIVVLTGGNYRINTALELFADGLAPKLLITGVHKSVKEYEILSSWKGEKPLPECCISLGRAATTTMENAQESKTWIEENKVKSVRIVTSAYHMPRALLEFHHLMPDIEIISNPVEEQDYAQNDWRYWYISCSEYNKILLRYASLLFIR